MLSSQLHATTQMVPLAGLDRLAGHLLTEWLENALACTDTASIRRRRLPAEQVVWLVSALALYRRQAVPEFCLRSIWLCPVRANGRSARVRSPRPGNALALRPCNGCSIRRRVPGVGNPDDCLVRMRVSHQALAKVPELPEYWTARAVRMVGANGKERILLTSLLDRRRFPAPALAKCYRRRWEIETSYRELKQSMLGEVLTLRSQQPEGVAQEIWGALIAYNLVRLEMTKAAIEAKVEPDDLSFLRALRIMQHEMIWAVDMAPGKLPAHLVRLRAQMQFAIVEKRLGVNAPVLSKPGQSATPHAF